MSEASIKTLEHECEYLREVLADYRAGRLDLGDVKAAAHTVSLNIMRCREELTEDAHHGG